MTCEQKKLHWVDLGWQDGGTGFGRRFRHHHRRWGRSQRCRSSNHLGAGLVDMRGFGWAAVVAHRFVGLNDQKNDFLSSQTWDLLRDEYSRIECTFLRGSLAYVSRWLMQGLFTNNFENCHVDGREGCMNSCPIEMAFFQNHFADKPTSPWNLHHL